MTNDFPNPPRVDPIGIVRCPPDYAMTPRAYPAALKAIAAGMLVVFALVVVVTTGISLGRYCLTSDGDNVAHLRPWLVGERPTPDHSNE